MAPRNRIAHKSTQAILDERNTNKIETLKRKFIDSTVQRKAKHKKASSHKRKAGKKASLANFGIYAHNPMSIWRRLSITSALLMDLTDGVIHRATHLLPRQQKNKIRTPNNNQMDSPKYTRRPQPTGNWERIYPQYYEYQDPNKGKMKNNLKQKKICEIKWNKVKFRKQIKLPK